jgi:hypothetical protein
MGEEYLFYKVNRKFDHLNRGRRKGFISEQILRSGVGPGEG